MLIKLKFHVPEIFLGAMLAVAIFAMGALFSSSTSPSRDNKAKNGAENGRAQIEKRPLLGEDKITDWLLVIFNFGLVVSTILLWRVTKNAADATRVAADSAKESADAAVAAERARFYVVIKTHNVFELISQLDRFPNSPTMPLSFEPKIEYAFKNYGKTPGIILEVAHGLSTNVGPPDYPVYVGADYIFSEHMIAADGETEVLTFDGPIMFQTQADGPPLIHGQSNFWFWGRFDYRDVFGRPQVHRFLLRYVRIGRDWGWQPYDHKHYNQST